MVIGVPRGSDAAFSTRVFTSSPCFVRVLEISSISQPERYSSSCIHKFVSLQES